MNFKQLMIMAVLGLSFLSCFIDDRIQLVFYRVSHEVCFALIVYDLNSAIRMNEILRGHT